MFPPGRGNDTLDGGDIYLISVFGTDEVLAAVGEDLRLQKYKEGQWSQMWICEINGDNRIGMRNRHTERFLGWDKKDKIRCVAEKRPLGVANFRSTRPGRIFINGGPWGCWEA